MKKQILSIFLMLVAIIITGSSLYLKKQDNTTTPNGNYTHSSNTSDATTQANISTPTNVISPAPILNNNSNDSTATPDTKSATATPSTAATPIPTAISTPNPTPTVQLTGAYTQETVDSLTSIGLTAKEINTLAEMDVTEGEIESVISSVVITPDMIAELDKYKDIWMSASDWERKMMINLLKQFAGKK